MIVPITIRINATLMAVQGVNERYAFLVSDPPFFFMLQHVIEKLWKSKEKVGKGSFFC